MHGWKENNCFWTTAGTSKVVKEHTWRSERERQRKREKKWEQEYERECPFKSYITVWQQPLSSFIIIISEKQNQVFMGPISRANISTRVNFEYRHSTHLIRFSADCSGVIIFHLSFQPLHMFFFPRFWFIIIFDIYILIFFHSVLALYWQKTHNFNSKLNVHFKISHKMIKQILYHRWAKVKSAFKSQAEFYIFLFALKSHRSKNLSLSLSL